MRPGLQRLCSYVPWAIFVFSALLITAQGLVVLAETAQAGVSAASALVRVFLLLLLWVYVAESAQSACVLAAYAQTGMILLVRAAN